MQSKAANVDEYLSEHPPEQAVVLERLRETIKQSLPSATECMRYGMPAYEMGEILCGFAAQKKHFSLYLMDTVVVNQYKSKFGKLSVGKGCIRFRKLADLPLDLVAKLLSEAGRRRESGITREPCDGR